MAKVSGSVPSLLYGVSEQPAHRRLEGQHGKVTNFTPNLVHGLVRRAGSSLLDIIGTAVPHSDEAFSVTDAKKWASYDFNLGGTQYTVYYRKVPTSDSTLPAMQVFNHTLGRFVHCEGKGYPSLGVMDAAGYSCCTQVGKFLVFGINNFTPTFTRQSLVGVSRQEGTKVRYNTGNWGSVIWIKSGLYGKAYKLKLRLDLVDSTGAIMSTAWEETFTHTTPKAQYDGILDTTSIPITDPAYQKKVNDAVHAYNTAVNQHIASANKAILPENIAKALGDMVLAKLYPMVQMVTVQGEYISIKYLHDSNGVAEASSWMWRLSIDTEVSGSGNDAMIILNQEVDSIEKLTAKAPLGKVVKVSPSQSSSYYLMAYPRGSSFRLGVDDLPTTEGFRVTDTAYPLTAVVWRECPEELIIPNTLMVIATIANNGNFYWGTSQSLLASVLGFDVPSFLPNKAGAKDTYKVPLALTTPISFMTTIQGRLVICGGGGILLSRSKDFFDFFPKSALAVTDDDPVDATVNGAEGDSLHSGITLGRDLLLFGTTKQYAVLGNQLITPKNFTIVSQEAVSLSPSCPPIALDNQVVFSKYDNGNSVINAIAFGDFEGMYKTISLSKQLNTYLKGYVTATTYVPEAGMLFCRTSNRSNSVVVMSLLPDNEGVIPSWCEWGWDVRLGTFVGMTAFNGKLRVLYLRKLSTGYLGFFMDEFSLSYEDSLTPLLDSKRSLTKAITLGSSSDLIESTPAVSSLAEDYLHSITWWLGRPMFFEDTDNRYIGYEFQSSLDMTSLFIRDGKGVSILDGRTVITSTLLHLKDTVALTGTVNAFGESTVVANHHYRNSSDSFITAKESLGTGTVNIHIGRDSKEYVLTVDSVKWYPLTITALEWQGHLFTNRR